MNKTFQHRPLLVICGPTSTGKTSLALYLAKKFGGELVSADSRQVYKNMNIGTGKGLLENSKFDPPAGRAGIRNSKLKGSYEIAGTRIWGYDLVDPKKDYSVAQYKKVAERIIGHILKQRLLPVLVGGTGLYIRAVVNGISTVDIPPNKKLRKSLSGKTKEELFEILAQLDSIKAASLNSSDRKNPRRLVRAIEVASQLKKKKEKEAPQYNTLFIGLNCEKSLLDAKIENRVDGRIKEGFENEVQKLIKAKVAWKSQSMTSLGYREWRTFLKGDITKEEAIKLWKSGEKKYSRRQITWFKKDKRINWFDITDSDYKKKVEKLVEKWYYGDTNMRIARE